MGYQSVSQYKSEEKNYVKLSVAGNQINNTFNISLDQNNSEQSATTMIYPDGTSGQYKIGELNFMDGAQKISVLLKVPAQEGLIELKEGNKNFDLRISMGDISLQPQSISVNVEEFIIDKIMGMSASYVKGSFEGIAIYKHTQNNKEMEEPYMVSGDFQYMSPRYRPKKNNR